MQTEIYECFAHPVILSTGTDATTEEKEYFKELSCAAKNLKVIMEYNTSYRFKQDLWKIVSQEGCEVIIGLDAHRPYVLEYELIYIQALENLKSGGIVPIIDLTRRKYEK